MNKEETNNYVPRSVFNLACILIAILMLSLMLQIIKPIEADTELTVNEETSVIVRPDHTGASLETEKPG